MLNNILRLMAFSAIVVFYFTMGGVGWLVFFDDRPVEIVHSITPVKQTFHRNEQILLRFQTTKLRDCPGNIVRTIVDKDENIYLLNTPPAVVARYGNNDLVLAFDFPPSLKPGRYDFQSKIEWVCNGITVIRQVNPRVPFEVIE